MTLKTDSQSRESPILFKFTEFKPNTIISSIVLYFCLVLLLLSMSSFLWAICIGVYFNTQIYKIGWSFAVVDILSGFIAPALSLGSFTLSILLLAYFTDNELSLRKILPLVLSSVKLIHNPKGIQYYLVANRFRYDITHKTNPKTKLEKYLSKRAWLETHFSTWALWLLFCLTFLFAFAQFINLTVIDERTSDICIPQYDCFVPTMDASFVHFICSNNSNMQIGQNRSFLFLHQNDTVFYCFKFIGLAIEGNLFIALGGSYALFLLGIKLIVLLFHALSIALHIKQSFIWSLILLALGLFGFAAIFLIYFLTTSRVILFNMLRFVAVIIMSLYMIVIGLLSLAYFRQDDWKESKSKKIENTLNINNSN